MVFRENKGTFFFYNFILFTTLIGIFSATGYYWKNGLLNSENFTASFEASMHFNELKNKSQDFDMLNLAESDRARDAIVKLTNLEKRVEALNHYREIESYEQLENSFSKSKKYLDNLISYPQIGNVILVLSSKVTNFESFVAQNRWRTLTRITKRLKRRISTRKIQTPGFFSEVKLSNLISHTNSDVIKMRKVTLDSVLSKNDKGDIIARLDNFNAELSMLKKYLLALDSFKKSFNKLEGNYNKWFSAIAPEISLARLELEKNTKNIVIVFASVVLFLLFGFIGGLILKNRESRKQQDNVEDFTLNIIKEGLISMENKLEKVQGSGDFRTEILKLREYYHKRISFGTVFQEAVPFSCVLLDSNLNLSWANDLFYEHWNLQDRHHEGANISWDFLQQYTNLGEDDPVLMAHQQEIAGIYQIQVKDPRNGERAPFEMYVSPVSYSGHKRIMIFFYPLRSLEETMADQTKSIVGPIGKILDSFNEQSFNHHLKDKFAKDFEVAGIGQLFSKIINYNEKITSMHSTMLGEIENLERSVDEQHDLILELESLGLQKNNVNNDVKVDFSNSRDVIVHSVELRAQVQETFEKFESIFEKLLSKEDELMVNTEKAGIVVKENQRAFEFSHSLKNDFSTLKGRFDEVRVHMSQSIEQTMQIARKTGVEGEMEASLTKVKMGLKENDNIMQAFNKLLRNLDVGLSKMSMIIEQADLSGADKIREEVENILEEKELIKREYIGLYNQGEISDDQTVESLKQLFQSFSMLGKLEQTSSVLIESFRENELDKNVIFTEDMEVSNQLSN